MARKKSSSSQRENIKRWLEEGNKINPMEALALFGCFRLSAVILNLKKHENMSIVTNMVYRPNGKRYAEYVLID